MIQYLNDSMTQCRQDSFFPILNGLPESDPHIQRAAAGRDSAREAAGYHGAKHGVRKEQRIVRPLGTPGQNHEHHPKRRAQEHKQQHSDAAEPYPRTEGEGLETETGASGSDVSAGDLSSPTLVESLAKGSLGSEIIARVVVSEAVFWVRDRFASPAQISNPLAAFYDFRA